MKVVFRTDASLQIGTGHVMRCLTLADALRERGSECAFICRPHQGNLLAFIAQRGHQPMALPELGTNVSLPYTELAPAHAMWLGTDWRQDADDTRQALNGEAVDWLVMDHYALDHHWEQALRPHCQRLMVIDDLADRKHDCDLLVDQNLGRRVEDYQGLIPAAAVCLAGPQYALLRPEFAAWRADSLARRAQPGLKRLLITMGGVDKDDMTGRVLEALRQWSPPPGFDATVVMGPHAPWLRQVQDRAAQMAFPVQVLVGVSDMARLMSECDLAIGAAGATSWERCCLGVPTIILVLADNQREVAAGLEQTGAAVVLEPHDMAEQLPRLLAALHASPARLATMGQTAAGVVDGNGVGVLIQLLES